MDNITDLLFELSNKTRYDILQSIHESRAKRHSEIQSDLKITGAEITRHLKRLKACGLVYKNPDNQYILTNLARIFLEILEIFKVSISYNEFFNKHEISPIPLELFFQIGKLRDVNLNSKTLENIELWSNLVKDSNQFIYAISDQFQNSLLPVVEKKMESKSIEIRALVNKKLITSYTIPEEWSSLFQDPSTFYKKLNIFENVKVLDKIDFSLLVSDVGAILFLKKDGSIDYSQCLIGKEKSFIDWIIKLFEWHWNKGKSLKQYIRRITDIKN